MLQILIVIEGLMSLSGICFWLDGIETAFEPERMGEKGG